MPGLTELQLPAETLAAGDRIEYFSQMFVCGDKRGLRSAVVILVDPQDDLYPVRVDTEELLPLDNMMRRTADALGNHVDDVSAKWRKLRTYQLTPGTFSASTRSSTLNSALAAIVQGAISSAHREGALQRERILPGGRQPDRESASHATYKSIDAASSSTSVAHYSRPESSGNVAEDSSPSRLPEDSIAPSTQANPAPTDSELLDAKAYLSSVPNRYARDRIRHQKKRRAGEWHVARSRKRRDQRKCAVTRSGDQIHHAHTVTALKMKQLLSLPAVRLRLVDLHERRKTYVAPVHDARFAHAEVPWPAGVERIDCNIPSGVVFPDLGDFGKCTCEGDCFIDTCENSAAAVYCTESCCNLGALCSNAPRVRDTLKLFDTGRVGLSVYTTADMDVGDIVGEYAGELAEYDAVVPGQPPVAVKENSGYTLLMNAKSQRKKYVYIDALRCGAITRFLSHSCNPNAAFVEFQHRSEVKVLVRMLKDVKAGAQITVNYGDETWFTCMCDECWSASAEDSLQDDRV